MRNLLLILSLTVMQLTAQVQGTRMTQLQYLQDLEAKAKETNNDSLFFVYNKQIQKTANNIAWSTKRDERNLGRHYLAVFYNNIACKKSDLGQYKQAYKNYFEALNYAEEISDSIMTGEIYNNIAAMLYEQKYYDLGLENIKKSIKACKTSSNLFFAYTSLSSVYFAKNELDSAIVYANKALQYHSGDSSEYAISLCNLASIQYIKKEYPAALSNFQTAFNIYKKDHPSGSVMMLSNVAKIYSNMGDIKNAEKYALQLREFATKYHSAEGLMEAAFVLKSVYKKQNKCKLELEETAVYYALRDSLLNESNKNDLIERDVKYKYDKKAFADSLKTEAWAKVWDARFTTEKFKAQNASLKMYASIILLILVCIFTALIINRLLLIRRQKAIITKQKNLVEEKQKETMASIRYAQTLQEAILPSRDVMEASLKNLALFYMPKDIVAGDFYWHHHSHTVNSHIEYIAVADSTGHGVPGAMVSVVCSKALTAAVTEHGCVTPAEILDVASEIVRKTFAKNKDLKDGMDISLLMINRGTKEIQWAGANNPIWYWTQQENVQGVRHEIKGDKQPVGNYIDTKPFTNHKIDYVPDTQFFLFTDGYADQFGGPENRKYKYKTLMEQLRQITHLDGNDQVKELYYEFQEWKGKTEQTDDVTIIGFKL